MKRTSIISAVAGLLLVTGLASCLKDKGFDDKKYGIDIDSHPAVSFPQAQNSPIVTGVNSQTEPIVVQGPYITLEGSGAASGDVTVTITQDNSLVALADTDYAILPDGSYSISTLTPVIAAGQYSTDAVKINIPNTTILDPTQIYAIGLTISSATGGYQVASNQKSVVFAFSIKNKYDGVYALRMKMSGWLAYGIAENLTDDWPEDVEMITSGASSVTTFNTFTASNLQPGWTGDASEITGATQFGVASPQYIFDNATNALIDVINTSPDDGRGRAFALNPAVTDSRWDPDTRTIYAAYMLKQTGRPNLLIYDTLTYTGER